MIMLTPHGSAAPQPTSVDCPQPWFYLPGQYTCVVNSVNSQGGQSFNWTSNTWDSSGSMILSGTCTTGQPVQVNLYTTNPYGTSLNQYSFNCP
jgi:hypothetical protein